MTDAAHIAALEERIAKLEAAAMLFETTRRECEKFSKSWSEFGEKLQQDEEKRKREAAAREIRGKNLSEQFDIERNFGDLKRAIADLTAEIRKLNAPSATH
jgi:predicted  nucleic acid-binding Zn-ribbon protein